MTDEVVHRRPAQGEGTTPCCDRSPVELTHDRITRDIMLVTCTGEDRAPPLTIYMDPLPPYKCTGEHLRRNMKYIGEHRELILEICDDPQCARIIAHCAHPGPQNKWNSDGTILTCTFCGRDCT